MCLAQTLPITKDIHYRKMSFILHFLIHRHRRIYSNYIRRSRNRWIYGPSILLWPGPYIHRWSHIYLSMMWHHRWIYGVQGCHYGPAYIHRLTDEYRRDHFPYVLTAAAMHLNFSLRALTRLRCCSPASPAAPPPLLTRLPAYTAPLTRRMPTAAPFTHPPPSPTHHRTWCRRSLVAALSPAHCRPLGIFYCFLFILLSK
jgi:hypothetical protein